MYRESLIRLFISCKYGKILYLQCRKREVVMYRKMIILFFYHEKKMGLSEIGRILNTNHASVYHHLKPVIDKDFDQFRAQQLDSLRNDFESYEQQINKEIK